MAARLGARRALALAAALLLPSAVAAWAGPPAAARLAWPPPAMAPAVAGFRPGERYGLLVVDGALLAGGPLALLGAPPGLA